MALADEIECSTGLSCMKPGLGNMQLGIKKTVQVIAALRLAAKSDEDEYLRQIVMDLFAPNKGHKDGCLTKSGGPCQCGWTETQVRYNAALSAAHRIATGHDYTKDFRGPVSATGKPKPKPPMPWIDAEEGDMS